MNDPWHWFEGLTAFLLIAGGGMSFLQAEGQTRRKAESLGKQNDDVWQQQRVTKVKRISAAVALLGVLVLLLPLLT